MKQILRSVNNVQLPILNKFELRQYTIIYKIDNIIYDDDIKEKKNKIISISIYTKVIIITTTITIVISSNNNSNNNIGYIGYLIYICI
eukprot:UN04374